MAQRTIHSPGVEIRETDLTTRGTANVGTNVYVTGFAQQGPIDEVLLISSKQEQLQIFGPPTTSAERYFHHTISEILNSPANVYASRLPYGAHLGDGFGSKYSALAYPVSAVESTTANSGALGGIATLNFAHSGVYVLGAPLHIELTQSQYLSCVEGTAFSWNNTGGSIKNLTNNAHSTAGVLSSLGSAGVVVLNKAQTTIDGTFQGYYLGLVDNASLNPASNFTSVKRAYTVDSTGGTVTSVISGGEWTEIPATTLQFATTANYKTGPDSSVSQVTENLTDYEINGSEYRDVLSLGTFKLRKSIFGDEAFKLDYVLEDGLVGSINYFRTELDQQGGPATSFFLGNKDVGSRNVEILVNDNISNRLSGGNSLDSDGNPTKWIRVYNSDLGVHMDSTAGRSEVGFNNNTYVNLSATLGSPFYGASAQGWLADVGPDAGNLFGIGAFSNAKVSAKEIGAVPNKIERVLSRITNDEVYDIDIVCEGGLGTIFAASCAASTTYFDEFNTDTSLQQAINGLRTSNDISGDSLSLRNDYNSIFNLFNNFCKPPYLAGGTRGDCIFIADVLRPILITGQKTKVLNNTDLNFQQDVLWPIRHQFESQNTSYAAVYGQWAQVFDNWIGQQVWVPFSGYAAAVMARTDTVANPWTAPAGFARGTINSTDIAINPNQKQRDELYKANINPVAFFPNQGQVIFGQKTLAKKPSAFDRINVRRLFLALERPTKKASRTFVFEPNNEFTRTRLVNVLTPIFETARVTGGLFDYLIVCDERNNPESVVEANELKVDIYLKPVRTAEFILVTFFATRTSQSFQELVGGGAVGVAGTAEEEEA